MFSLIKICNVYFYIFICSYYNCEWLTTSKHCFVLVENTDNVSEVDSTQDLQLAYEISNNDIIYNNVIYTDLYLSIQQIEQQSQYDINDFLVISGERVGFGDRKILTVYFTRVGNTDFADDVDAVSGASLLSVSYSTIMDTQGIPYHTHLYFLAYPQAPAVPGGPFPHLRPIRYRNKKMDNALSCWWK